MPTVVTERTVSDSDLEFIRLPIEGMVGERTRDGSAHRVRFMLDHGPFRSYERILEIRREEQPTDRSQSSYRVTQTVNFELAVPVWGWVFTPLVKREFRRIPQPGRSPWWTPPQRMDARATAVLALLCLISVFTGYMGTLLSQTNTFFKQEFDVSDGAVGMTLAAVRVGALLALGIVMVADRRGRRKVLLVATVAACLMTATGALAPDLVWLGVSQTVARALSTAMALIISIIAIEETPSGSRAFAVSVLAATAALGAGIAVMMLWVADLGVSAWRILYVVPLAAIPVTIHIGRDLPETLRFEAHVTAPPDHRSRHTRIPRSRLLMLAGSGLLFALFVAPASGFLNEYLRTDRGFDAGSIIAFQLLTNTPGGIGLVVGGQLADRYGRRIVGAIGMGGGVAFTVAMYLIDGPSIWLWSLLGAILGTAAVPALAVYGSELFPTGVRGRANGVINLFSVTGSSIGLGLAGVFADNFGGLGMAMAILAIGPATVVLMIVFLYPETSGQKLETLNPVDVNIGDSSGGGSTNLPATGS